MTDPIRENQHYKIVVGESILHQGDNPTTCYQLVNKETGVVETETTILPQAMDWMEEFSRLLENPDSRNILDDLSITAADHIKTVQ